MTTASYHKDVVYTQNALERLHQIDRERKHWERIAATLRWDQETYLPLRGVAERAEQLALVEGAVHRRAADPEAGRLLRELGSETGNPGGGGGLPPVERDFLKVLRRAYDRAALLPQEFVEAAARAEGLSLAAWVEARRNNDFAALMPHLQTMVDMARKKAAYWGFQGAEVYDALLDCYEPGFPAAELVRHFGILRERLSALLRRIGPRGGEAFLGRDFDLGLQARYSRELMDTLGFDHDRGRLDTSAHPFTTTLGSHDVRITTRYHRDNLVSGIFSTIHELGHAFYELRAALALGGSSLGEGASMGIHESQSRLWENVIGRSRAFWEGQFPRLQFFFPDQLATRSLGAFYRGINQVRPSAIRIEADEVSYSLHIILRFELEQGLFSGNLTVEELPAAWRAAMRDLLGVEPETDAQGVLQDVHWAMGAFGYFPSYALGNLYGLQFWKKLCADLPGIESAIAKGCFGPIHAWLGDQIHAWGRRLDPPDLLRRVTGETLSAYPFLEYLETKYTELYGL
ncbi:MAG: carboxypeptidase M32 [Treponema sp.]|jgi:carboxypeptidase Taq|nr:carboxypeptidase M32 [Treponema sp.]